MMLLNFIKVYFYLLKRKSNGVLVEYARKRDSCSFLISNLILEEYSNDFFIYSSNKYGTNRERAAKITIENRDMLNKNGLSSEELDEMHAKASRLTYIICTLFVFALVFLIVCCLLMRCKRDNSRHHHHHQEKRYSSDSMYNNNNNNIQQQPHVHFQYSAPANRTSTAIASTKFYNGNGSIKLNGNLLDEKMAMNGLEKEDYFDGSAADETSSNEPYEKEDYTGVYDNNSYKRSYSKLNEQNIRSPSLINSIF